MRSKSNKASPRDSICARARLLIRSIISALSSPNLRVNCRMIKDRPSSTHQNRLVSIRGELEPKIIEKINHALKVVFDII
jgi:hypothetical protein